jgi:type IV pilus assembly protein PilW
MNSLNLKNTQRGLTLVELMVAMVIGLALIAGVTELFITNKQTYRLTDASSRIQESARFTFRFLTKDVRMAGYNGCAGEAMTVTNTLNDSSSFLYDFGTSVQGFEATSGSAWTPTVPTAITSPKGGSDILTVRGIFGDGVDITGQPSNSGDCNNSASHTAVLKVSDASSLDAGDIVIAGNCSRASILQITNVNAGSNVVHNTGGAHVPGNKTKDLAACYAGNGQMFKISTLVFYVRNNPDGNPSLYRNDEELVEGVENMQVEYGVGSGATNLVDQFLTADNVTAADWPNVISVRLNLLMRSIEENITTAPQTYTFNGASVTADSDDKKLYRTYTTTIAIRNRLK